MEALLTTVLGNLSALFTAQSSLCSVDNSHFAASLTRRALFTIVSTWALKDSVWVKQQLLALFKAVQLERV